MTERVGRFILVLLASLFAVAIGHAGARLTWTLVGQTSADALDLASARTAPAPGRQLDLGPILTLAPFGQTTVAALPQAAVQETSLGLVLRGVVVAVPARDSIAVIAANDGPAKLYGVEDSIEGRATLREIRGDRVLLDVDGKAETLSFPKPGANPSAAKVAAVLGNAAAAVPGATSAVGSAPRAPSIEALRRKVQQNPKALLDSFGVSASAGGYRIDPNAASGVLRTGLRPGDVVAKVNGEPVGDIERDRRLFDTVVASGRVRVEVVRDGRTVVMSFPLQ